MKLEQATIKNTKIGDKCYVEVSITDIEPKNNYSIECDNWSFTKEGKLNKDITNRPQLYHLIQEEIPTLVEGIEMEVSANGVDWTKEKIVAKLKTDTYISNIGFLWKYARPTQLTLEQKLENALKEIEELKKQLNGK